MLYVKKENLFDENAISRTIKRISHEILEKNDDLSALCLIGIKTRGLPLAQRIASCIKHIEEIAVPTLEMDVTLYRDDLTKSDKDPHISSAVPDLDPTGKNIILVDDVIYTGRTVRAALDAVITLGRPDKIQLAVLIDRGHRELPIRPDYVGKNIPTSRAEIVRVQLLETDGADKVDLCEIRA